MTVIPFPSNSPEPEPNGLVGGILAGIFGSLADLLESLGEVTVGDAIIALIDMDRDELRKIAADLKDVSINDFWKSVS